MCMARASVATQLLRGRALASAYTACAAGIAFCAARNIPGEKSTPTIGPRWPRRPSSARYAPFPTANVDYHLVEVRGRDGDDSTGQVHERLLMFVY